MFEIVVPGENLGLNLVIPVGNLRLFLPFSLLYTKYCFALMSWGQKFVA